MSQTVFVIHGVKNHVEADFRKRVQELEERVGPGLILKPVFWGDLGGANRFLDQVIPSADAIDDVQPASAGPFDAAAPAVTHLEKALLSGPRAIADAEHEDATVEPFAAAHEPGTAIALLAQQAAAPPGSEGLGEGDWRTVLEEVWAEVPHLASVADEELLRRLGDALGKADPTKAADAPTGFDEAMAVRGFGLDSLKQVVRGVNDAIAAVVGASAGRLNELLRTKIAPDAAQFAGDIIVYQGERREAIQQRVRDLVRAEGLGTADRPARFIAHSLGGVITLDLCSLGHDPLHVEGLVTFGSQWPLFSLIDPTGRVAPPYDGTTPLRLPASLTGSWINLWEPLDPLAFVAAHVFSFADGRKPDDRRADYRTSSGLWTHSAYWGLPELRTAIADTFPASARAGAFTR